MRWHQGDLPYEGNRRGAVLTVVNAAVRNLTGTHNRPRLPGGMRRAVTVGLPALAGVALIFAAAMEIAFLKSPAASYCPEYGGILQFCFWPPSNDATLTMWLALGLAGLSAVSVVFAWRGQLGKAGMFALPGLIGVVLALVSAIGGDHTALYQPLLNTPPPSYVLHEIGGYAALVGSILLGVACCVQLAAVRRHA